MNESKRSRIKKAMIFIFFIIIISGLNTYSHEQVHKSIMINHGCQEVEIKYFNWDLRSTAQCLSYYDRPDMVAMQEIELHSFNEIVSYNLNTILIAMVCCAAFLSAMKRP